MRALAAALLATTAIAPLAQAGDLTPGITLRAAYLATNPTQAMRDPATNQLRGPVPELARELARRHVLTLELTALTDPPAVIEAVRSGTADIGFVAYEATRIGTVGFSQPYMLVRQSFLVLDASPIRGIDDIDRPERTIAGTINDSITLCMRRLFHQAKLVDLPNDPTGLSRALTGHEIDALAANRQRLTALMKLTPGTRLLPDDLFSVPQNVAVPKDRPAALTAVNDLIDELRASGKMQAAIEGSGAVGVGVAPAGIQAGCPAQ